MKLSGSRSISLEMVQHNCISQYECQHDTLIYHLPSTTRGSFILSLRKEKPPPASWPELSPHTPVSSYSWPRRTQVADEVVSPSCFRSSLSSCPFSWCPLCHSFCQSVVCESCNVIQLAYAMLYSNRQEILTVSLGQSACYHVRISYRLDFVDVVSHNSRVEQKVERIEEVNHL